MTTDAQSNTRLTGRWLMLARIAWIAIAITAVGMFVAGVPYALTAYSQQVSSFVWPELMEALRVRGISPQLYAMFTVASLFVAGLIWVTVGAVIFVRKSADGPALTVSVALVTFGTQTPLRGALAQALPALSLPFQILTVVSWTSFALFLALFPSGHFVPRWLRWLVLGWAVGLLTKVFDSLLPKSAVGVVFSAFWAIFLLAQLYRYVRVSTLVERQQTKWVFLGLAALFAIYIPLFILVLLEPGQINSPYLIIFANFIPVIIPLSIGVAVLRSRLFDIDLIIRRTLQYSVLSGLLALVYFGGIVVLQRIFTTLTGQGQNQLVTVISTLVIAALFLPLRRRVQDVIDRRFYRKKYDAAKTLAAFAATCRDETDLDKLTARLVEVVQETMQPEHVSLWLKPTETRPDRFPKPVRSESASQTGEQA